jgi:hypothetical protein
MAPASSTMYRKIFNSTRSGTATPHGLDLSVPATISLLPSIAVESADTVASLSVLEACSSYSSIPLLEQL